MKSQLITKASKELEKQIEEELKQEEPSAEKAKAAILLNTEKTDENADTEQI